MKIFRGSDSPFHSVDAKTFVGAARAKLLSSDEEAVPVHVYHVQFDEGARTNWHTHSGPQWLLITEGRVRVQRLGEPPRDLETGDAVVFSPGEKHWHGAAPGSRGVHLAVNINVTTEWLEPVSEADYAAVK
ncbi:MAG: cupin domain-containing protein [Luteitalea sp.]|nr:cupin domain-containing protein [Luteitalea sp.]